MATISEMKLTVLLLSAALGEQSFTYYSNPFNFVYFAIYEIGVEFFEKWLKIFVFEFVSSNFTCFQIKKFLFKETKS